MKTTSPKTHIGSIRFQSATEAEQVQHILGWSHGEWCEFQFAEYCAFVEAISYGYPAVKTDLLYSPVFRGFWNNEWTQRDRIEFLDFAPESDLPAEVLETEYRFIHSHERLLEEDLFMVKYSHLLKLL